nr:MAG TPA: hypothetical protein [Caudoviricetes sp.]
MLNQLTIKTWGGVQYCTFTNQIKTERGQGCKFLPSIDEGWCQLFR